MSIVLGNQFRLDVLSSGSAGVLLCFAHVHSQLWFTSLFAVAILLWRLRRCSSRRALNLGFSLATTFVFSTYFGCLLTSPTEFFLRVALFNTGFGILALIANRLYTHLKVHPPTIVFLWCPAVGSMVLGVAHTDRVALGIWMAPGSVGAVGLACCATILGRWLMLMLTRFVKRRVTSQSSGRASGFKRRRISDRIFRCEFLWCAVPTLRGPPLGYR